MLEDRRLAAVDIYFDDGIRGGGPDHPELRGVHIVGTDRADRIEITHQGGQLKVWAARPTGTGLVSVFNADDVPRIFFYGLKGNDSFASNSAIETIVSGGEGDDTITGGWGQVHYYGDAGQDYIQPGNLAYGSLYGGSGNDELRAGKIGMNLYGEGDNDYLFGDSGDDYLDGGSGNDQLFGDEGPDTLVGGQGNDQLQAGPGDDHLYGNDGYDFLSADSGLDWLDGGADRDFLDGGKDALVDRVFGGSGPDIFIVEWKFYDGSIHYFDDEVYDFALPEGDRYLYYDFEERLFTEWAGMNYADFYSAAGGATGFAALDDSLMDDAALAANFGLYSDPMQLMQANSNLYVEPSDSSLDLTAMDLEISIFDGEEVFEEPIVDVDVFEAVIDDSLGLEDLAIVDAAFIDYIPAPTISPVTTVNIAPIRKSLRLF
jgi:hypothetical protein